MSIKLPLITDWHICTPTLFRFMEREFVDAFFEDGSLRISSFEQFKKHEDEQRLDGNEGQTMFVHRTDQGGGQTVSGWAQHGMNAYVLSTTMMMTPALMDAFQADSYLRIMNSTGFGMAVARKLPGVRAAYEGPCIYQDKKIIERDLGYLNLNRFKVDGQLSQPAITEFLLSKMRHFPLFLKDKLYAHQVEYRFIWVVDEREDDYIDIKVPDAIKNCLRPNELTE